MIQSALHIVVCFCVRCGKRRPTEANVYCDDCLRYLDERLHLEIYGPLQEWEKHGDDE